MTFGEFVRANGLFARRIVPDGRWRRCPTESHPRKRNGAYRLAPGERIGWAQDWTTQLRPAVWRPDAAAKLPAYDPAVLDRAAAEQRQKRRRAIREARQFYASCPPLRGGHPYLASHGLGMEGCFGLRVDSRGWLVVPAAWRGRTVSVQRIGPAGEKRFWPGAPVRDTEHVIERRQAALTVYAEGLATGLAIYAAVPLARVVVRFDAGNLKRVAKVRTGLTVVAADNDHATAVRLGTNPGIEAARGAAEAIGCGVAVPEGMDGTDWCDWRAEQMQARLAAWNREPWESEQTVRQAVDAEIAAAMAGHARFVA